MFGDIKASICNKRLGSVSRNSHGLESSLHVLVR